MNKQDILKQAKQQRLDEIFAYQINIDNYTLAIKHITASGDESLFEFRDKLASLLSSEILEQKKANVMLAVIEQQLGD